MKIYSLKDGYYLTHDIEFVLELIDELYKVEVKSEVIAVTSKVQLSADQHFASKESTELFNKLIPKIKALHTTMYHLLESIYKASINKEFNIRSIENQYPDFKYFRLLNNKIKHFNDIDIDLIQVVLMDGGTKTIEIGCQFKLTNEWELKYYKNFVSLILNILKNLNIIMFDADNK